MRKNETINVSGAEIRVTKFNDEDYICLTDMLKAKDGEFFITDWLRNRNTLEYIGPVLQNDCHRVSIAG